MLRDEALDKVREIDAGKGESWSNDSYAIAELIAEFHKEKCKEMRDIIRKGTVNRRYYKGWESDLIDMLEEE